MASFGRGNDSTFCSGGPTTNVSGFPTRCLLIFCHTISRSNSSQESKTPLSFLSPSPTPHPPNIQKNFPRKRKKENVPTHPLPPHRTPQPNPNLPPPPLPPPLLRNLPFSPHPRKRKPAIPLSGNISSPLPLHLLPLKTSPLPLPNTFLPSPLPTLPAHAPPRPLAHNPKHNNLPLHHALKLPVRPHHQHPNPAPPPPPTHRHHNLDNEHPHGARPAQPLRPPAPLAPLRRGEPRPRRVACADGAGARRAKEGVVCTCGGPAKLESPTPQVEC